MICSFCSKLETCSKDTFVGQAAIKYIFKENRIEKNKPLIKRLIGFCCS